MSGEQFDKWCEENGTQKESLWVNGIHYHFVTMKDSWVAIFEYWNGNYAPKIQAMNRAKAIDWVSLREPVTVPMQQLC